MYARPSNSGPGRTFVMGLPYLLGDKDPMDPINGWDKTWSYLKELDSCIEYYPGGTTATMKELGEGSRDMIATTTGWDINPRYLGIVPEEFKIATLKGFHWVGDANYMAIPKGVPEEKVDVLLQLIAYLLKPEQQAFMYDHGYMYPGPAIHNVPLEMAPKESQDTIKKFGRPEYADLIANNPIEPPLDAKPLVAMFNKWDREIGGSKARQ
jgi:putative spermidine/putrescine transport system substrate-binding protein